jgi:hypothetical protein
MSHEVYEYEWETYKAMFPAVPVPPPRPALDAVLFASAVAAQDEMAALSAADSVEAVAPPVPSFAIAAMASAGMVRDDWEVAPARTVAMLVVLRTEADEVAVRRARRKIGDFIVIWEGWIRLKRSSWKRNK